MSAGLSESLKDLQGRLAQARTGPAEAGPPTEVVFMVGGVLWSLPSAHVARVALATSLLPVAPHVGMPRAVIGVVHSQGDVLTVVDAAVLTGGSPTVTTSRTRLISIAADSARGFALLVDRVLELVPAGSARARAKEFDLNALSGAF